MARRRASTVSFDAIAIEGAFLATDMLARIAAIEAADQTEADYDTPPGLKLRDEIGRYYRIGEALWATFYRLRERDQGGVVKPILSRPPKYILRLKANEGARPAKRACCSTIGQSISCCLRHNGSQILCRPFAILRPTARRLPTGTDIERRPRPDRLCHRNVPGTSHRCGAAPRKRSGPG
jgi:hypothetical protein